MVTEQDMKYIQEAVEETAMLVINETVAPLVESGTHIGVVCFAFMYVLEALVDETPQELKAEIADAMLKRWQKRFL